MNANLVSQLGSLVGFTGMIVCLATLVVRLTGQYYLGGLPLATLF